MAVQEIVGNRSDSKLYHVNDGFLYIKNRIKNNRMFLKCQQNGCVARASMPLLEELRHGIRLLTPHTHDPDHTVLEVINLKKIIKDRCQAEVTEPRTIFDEECARVPIAISGQVGFDTLRSSMYKARRRGTAPIPQSLVDLDECLNLPNNANLSRTNLNEVFYHGKVEDPIGGVSLVFGSPTIISSLGECQELHIDGTFKVRPMVPLCRQLLTLMSIHFDQAFPAFFVLMERKNAEAYTSVFNFIKTNIAPTLNPRVIITDFELSLQSSAQAIFPNSHLVGCWFHAANAMRRRARSLGIPFNLANLGDVAVNMVKKILRMTMALPLLPQQSIALGFLSIRTFAAQHNLEEVLEQYFNYVEQTWIAGVGAQHLSVFGQRNRTNNLQEAYHKQLLMKLGRHPNAWRFVEGLRKMEAAYIHRYTVAANGGVGQRPRPSAYIAQDLRICETTRKLVEGIYSIVEFLHNVSYALASIVPDAPDFIDEEEGEAVPPPPAPAHVPALPAADPHQPAVVRGRGGRRRAGRRGAAGGRGVGAVAVRGFVIV